MHPYFADLAAPGMPKIDFADVKTRPPSGNPARNGPPPQMWSPSRIGVTLRGGHAVQGGGMHGEQMDLLTVKKVTGILRCSKTHALSVIEGRVRGLPKLPHLGFSRRKVVRKEWLPAWMEENKTR
jgi:hypothetical protein